MCIFAIAACAGAWIEITMVSEAALFASIAACAGAWIEIFPQSYYLVNLPIAACAGAWIEISHGDNLFI